MPPIPWPPNFLNKKAILQWQYLLERPVLCSRGNHRAEWNLLNTLLLTPGSVVHCSSHQNSEEVSKDWVQLEKLQCLGSFQGVNMFSRVSLDGIASDTCLTLLNVPIIRRPCVKEPYQLSVEIFDVYKVWAIEGTSLKLMWKPVHGFCFSMIDKPLSTSSVIHIKLLLSRKHTLCVKMVLSRLWLTRRDCGSSKNDWLNGTHCSTLKETSFTWPSQCETEGLP